jgi:hypothetical protein
MLTFVLSLLLLSYSYYLPIRSLQNFKSLGQSATGAIIYLHRNLKPRAFFRSAGDYLADYSFNVENKRFQNTASVPRATFLNLKIGQEVPVVYRANAADRSTLSFAQPKVPSPACICLTLLGFYLWAKMVPVFYRRISKECFLIRFGLAGPFQEFRALYLPWGTVALHYQFKDLAGNVVKGNNTMCSSNFEKMKTHLAVLYDEKNSSCNYSYPLAYFSATKEAPFITEG